VRDEWLESGADLRTLVRAAVVRHEGDAPDSIKATDFSFTESGTSGWMLLAESGLAPRIEAQSFVDSAHEAFRLLLFRQQFLAHVGDLDEYLRPIVTLRLPAAVVHRLPCRRADEAIRVLVTPAEWSEILRDCAGRATSTDELDDLVRASINMVLREAGVAPASATDPRTLDALAVVDAAPPFLREASLPLADKYALAQLMSAWTGAEDELLAVGERASRVLSAMRRNPEATRARDATAEGAFAYAIQAVRSDRLQADRRRALVTRTDLVECLTDHIALSASDIDLVDGQALADVLRQRLQEVPTAELQLLGGLVLGIADAVQIWRNSLPGGPAERSVSRPAQGTEA